VETSAFLLVGFAVVASAAAIAFLWWSSVRADHRWQTEKRLQAVLDVYAEREIARERLRKAARGGQDYSPHGTILQLR
jgi:hypothetical protein